ncbi:MAG: 50S ribosomal protein L25 [Candidatus Komeilibacteria bacterium]
MKKNYNLAAEIRPKGSKGDLKAGRLAGKIPAVLYGWEQDNVVLWLDAKQADNVFSEAGTSSLINLQLGDKDNIKVIIKDLQTDPVSDKIVHLDLYKPDLNKPVEVSIPIHLYGEAPAVKSLGGTLLHAIDSIDIRCLPENLIHEVKVDISSIEDFDTAIHVSSIAVPANVEVLTDPEQVVASATPPRVEEVETSEEEEGAAEEGADQEGDESKEETAAKKTEGDDSPAEKS